MELTSGVVNLTSRSPSALESRQTGASALRRTLGIITVSGPFWCVWFNTTTGEPLTLFAQNLGASNFEFGLLTALPFLASLMAVPGSLLVERTGLRKAIFLPALYAQRLLWAPIALVPLMLLNRPTAGATASALNVFLLLMLAMYAIGSIGSPAWLSWMADVVPSRIKGKYFARRRQWAICAAVPIAVFIGWFLDHGVGQASTNVVLGWCAVFFLCAAVCGLADIHMYQYVPARNRPPEPRVGLLETFREPLADRPFLLASAFIGMLTFALTFLGQFATLYLLDSVHMGNMGVQMALVVAPMVGQWLTLGAWGRAADRAGNRPLLVLASIGLVPVGAAWCFVTPANAWLAYVLSGLGAALWTGVEVVTMNLVLERSAGRRGASGYAATNTVIINIAGCLGGLAAGGIAQLLAHWHWQPFPSLKTFSFYDALFVAGGLLRLAAVALFLPLLHEPSAQSVHVVLRFMASHFAQALWPATLRRKSRTDPQPFPRLAPEASSTRISPDPVAPRRAA